MFVDDHYSWSVLMLLLHINYHSMHRLSIRSHCGLPEWYVMEQSQRLVWIKRWFDIMISLSEIFIDEKNSLFWWFIPLFYFCVFHLSLVLTLILSLWNNSHFTSIGVPVISYDVVSLLFVYRQFHCLFGSLLLFHCKYTRRIENCSRNLSM